MSKGIMKNPLFEKTARQQNINTAILQDSKEQVEALTKTGRQEDRKTALPQDVKKTARQEASKPALPQNSKEKGAATINTSRQHNSNTFSQQDSKERNDTVKMTCYMSPDSSKRLEKIWYESRTKHGAKITRSYIVDRAVELLERDLSEHQNNSYLMKSRAK